MRSSSPETSSDLRLVHGELLDQVLAHVGIHRGRHLDPDDLAEAAAAQLVLDRAEKVVGLVRDGEVRVARDPEVVVAQDLHAREERVEVARDDPLERHEDVLADLHEARQDLLRDLDARKGLGARHRIAQPHSERERQVRDVREGAPGADGERGQHREDLLGEDAVDRLELVALATGAVDDPDAVLGERGGQLVVPHVRVAGAELAGAFLDALERLARREAVDAARVDAGVDLVVQAGHPHHHELVQIGGVDGAELHALEQRRLLVLRQLENALVELQPGQLPVREQLG